MTPSPGTATAADLIAKWETPPHSRCELVEGTLVERCGSFLGSVILASLAGRVGSWTNTISVPALPAACPTASALT
jgi:hypothetical protein